MAIHLFGIRHHGPGSARSLVKALNELKPDAILIEGPPEADGILSLVRHERMAPPVALLIYSPDEPSRAVYYPFALFSPEWQALLYGAENGLSVRFMDLPPAHFLALQKEREAQEEKSGGDETAEIATTSDICRDPLHYLALAAGFGDSESWWEHMVEKRCDGAQIFQGIAEAMTALRHELGDVPGEQDAGEIRRERLRECHMRRAIRKAEKEGFNTIAVICGAWHVPALQDLSTSKEDEALLKGLPQIKTEATWIPWTHGRLAFASGYGAGVTSPGWYHHLWSVHEGVTVNWLTRVARTLRGEGIDVSPAHVIEAVRLAETLAAMRERPLPGLEELNEAVRSVLLFGEELPMGLIHQRLVVGEVLGAVPEETPMTPLQRDLMQEQKRVRLQPDAGDRELILDLRKPLDLEKSTLLRRLELLGIPWGKGGDRARGKGTFKESWRIQWQPEFAVRLIEAGIWGTTVVEAATALAVHGAGEAKDLPTLTDLVRRVMYASLDRAVEPVMQRLQNEAAVATDVAHLMAALPPLAQLMRYGDVRNTSTAMVEKVIEGLVARICIGLPGACAGAGEEPSRQILEKIEEVHGAVGLLEVSLFSDDWRQALQSLSKRNDVHGVLQGRSVRLLLDCGAATEEESVRDLGLALSPGNDPGNAAAWVEGFLRGSGQILIYDERLWNLIDQWVSGLSEAIFVQMLPVLRRTFADFSAPERRQLGERVRRGRAVPKIKNDAADFDTERAERALPLLVKLLGIEEVTNVP